MHEFGRIVKVEDKDLVAIDPLSIADETKFVELIPMVGRFEVKAHHGPSFIHYFKSYCTLSSELLFNSKFFGDTSALI